MWLKTVDDIAPHKHSCHNLYPSCCNKGYLKNKVFVANNGFTLLHLVSDCLLMGFATWDDDTSILCGKVHET